MRARSPCTPVFAEQPESRRRGTTAGNSPPARRRTRTACERHLTDTRQAWRRHSSRIGHSLPAPHHTRASSRPWCAGDGYDPHRGQRVGEATNPGPPCERAVDMPPVPCPGADIRNQRARALHALAQMRRLPDGPPSPAGTISDMLDEDTPYYASPEATPRHQSPIPAHGPLLRETSASAVGRGLARLHASAVPATRCGPAMARHATAERPARPGLLLAICALVACSRRPLHQRGRTRLA